MPHKRNKKAEEFYELLPSDPTLDDDEYYVKICNSNTGSERVFKGFVVSIAWDKYNREMFQLSDGHRLLHSNNPGNETWWYQSQMYDNKEDCRDDAHCGCDHWEED